MATLVITLVCLLIAYFWRHDGVFSKMSIVVSHNPFAWVVVAVFIAVPLYLRYRDPTQLTMEETIFQMLTVPFVGHLVLSFFFYVGTDLHDQEFLSAYATEARYHEEWTGEVEHESCDANGKNCRTWTTCSDHHPAYWELLHSINSHGAPRVTTINSGVYRNFVSYFGNEHEESEAHVGQCSLGDGDVWITTFKGKWEERIPTVVSHEFVNYVKGSKDTLRRTSGAKAAFKQHLKPYPTLKSGTFGPIEVDRVVTANVQLPRDWAKTVDETLDFALTDLGEKKQVNLLVYVAGTSNQAFLNALDEHWVGGKKNDVIVVIGSADGHEIDWAGVLAWTDNELFKVKLRDRIVEMETLDNNAEAIAKAIIDQVEQPGESGFQRKPMEEMKYLAGDVRVPFWCWLIILLSMSLYTWMVSWALANNDTREYSH